MSDLFDDVHRLQSCAPDALTATAIDLLRPHGIESFIASTMTDFPSRGLTKHHGVAQSYDREWMDRYAQKKYEDIDPVRHEILRGNRFFYWSDLKGSNHIQNHMMNEASEFGLRNGIGISIPFSRGEIFGIGYNIDANRFPNCSRSIWRLRFFSEVLSERIVENAKAPSPTAGRLSDREKLILELTAMGKSANDIGDIIGISANTVNYHFRNIFNKFECRSKITACVKAFARGDITGDA